MSGHDLFRLFTNNESHTANHPRTGIQSTVMEHEGIDLDQVVHWKNDRKTEDNPIDPVHRNLRWYCLCNGS